MVFIIANGNVETNPQWLLVSFNANVLGIGINPSFPGYEWIGKTGFFSLGIETILEGKH